MRSEKPDSGNERAHRPPSVATTALAAVALALALYVAAVPFRGGPPLGRFLDPVHGVWAVATRADLPVRESHKLDGAAAPVDVRFDDRAVPHIFAASQIDAWRALGYVHARDRLFQMELQTRAAAGTLSEILGARALDVDREARAQGLAWSADRAYRELDPNSDAIRAARAYSDGVNTFIEGMTPADYPLEYHLLGAKPQRWEPEYSAYLLARMGLTLAYTDGELQRAQIEALVGKPATAALFPENAPIVEPIQPNGQRAPRFDFTRIPAPLAVDSAKLAAATELRRAAHPFGRPVARFGDQRAGAGADLGGEIAVGSNNWAVSPKRSASGHALLAGDPHLSLSLPSIWYEAHLVVPDTLDVYGVTLLGSPFITIGFNRDVAWTFTNTGADVTDYYAETVDDDAHPTKYKLDGEWKKLETRVETVRGKTGAALATDTIYHTHRGPMQRWGKSWISRRWTVLEPHNTMDTFRRANLAKSAAELMQAFEGYEVAAQNVLTADRGGHIAIRSNGHFPIRGGKGNVVLDGSTTANDWTGYWPLADYPQSFDPPRGFLSSNNQQPKDPKVDPRYLGWDWPAPWRAMRINALLRADSAVTPDAMRRWQTDPISEQTAIFQRAFLRAAESSPAPVDSSAARAAHLLAEWDGRFTRENERAVLYSAALDELARRTWDELGAPGAPPDDRPRRVATPNSMILAELLDDPTNPWWDVRATKNVVEDRDTILRQSLAAAYDRVVKMYGEPGPAWRWEKIRHANINHLLRIPAFSRVGIPMQAGPGTLSPSAGDGTHGASWRMVVELGPEVRAWGTYPGGQSGNPASSRYTDRLAKWTAGELDTLRFPRRAAELTGRTLTSSLTLTPATTERKP